MDGNGYGMDGSGSWVFAALLLGGLVLLILLAVRLSGDSWPRRDRGATTDGSAPVRSAAREILDDRLARGELTPADYQYRLEILREPL
jgi:putative membrane protein